MDLRLRKEVLDFLHYVCYENRPGDTPDPKTKEEIQSRSTMLINKIIQDNVLVRGISIPRSKINKWVNSIKFPKNNEQVISPRIRAIKEVRITYNLPLSEAKALIDEIVRNGY